MATAESEAELSALGGEALTGRRVARGLPSGESYTGTVVGASGRPDRLVVIHYDNGDVEELNAEDLADCLVPLQRPPPQRRRVRPPLAAVRAAALKDEEEEEERPSEGEEQAQPHTRLRAAAAGPYARSSGLRSAGAAEMALLRRRPRVASPGKRYRGTTLCGKAWKAQLHHNGVLHFSCGHATEVDAARAWNVLARRFGRTDLNVIEEDAAGEQAQ